MIVNGFVLASLLGGGLALWLLFYAIRRKIRAGGVNNRQASARETSALLAALFGFPAGAWIYDKLYPCSEEYSG
jgi:hypothetical protein